MGIIQIVVFIIVAFFIVFKSCWRIVAEYERLVVFTLGRLNGARGPGLRFIIPGIQRSITMDTRTITMDIPPQDIITKDNVSVKVNAVVYFRVIDVNKAITEVENYQYATNQLAQTTLRSVCGEAELDDLLSGRETMNHKIQDQLDGQTDPWGIKVSLVELKHIDLAPEMQRAMAKQAEAERERRAKIINSQGEFQSAQKLLEAAQIIDQAPSALHLRYLQTLREISTENSSTVIFPLPMDLLKAFLPKDK